MCYCSSNGYKRCFCDPYVCQNQYYGKMTKSRSCGLTMWIMQLITFIYLTGSLFSNAVVRAIHHSDVYVSHSNGSPQVALDFIIYSGCWFLAITLFSDPMINTNTKNEQWYLPWYYILSMSIHLVFRLWAMIVFFICIYGNESIAHNVYLDNLMYENTFVLVVTATGFVVYGIVEGIIKLCKWSQKYKKYNTMEKKAQKAEKTAALLKEELERYKSMGISELENGNY